MLQLKYSSNFGKKYFDSIKKSKNRFSIKKIKNKVVEYEKTVLVTA